MNRWTRTQVLLAGLALILLTNGVALLGVWWNRGGTPESTLELTQRELHTPYLIYREQENSGIALSLRWRVPSRTQDDADHGYVSYWGGEPGWLDASRMAELGFSIPSDDGVEPHAYRAARQLPREVLLVLELAGESWQAALARAQESATRAAKLAAANPSAKDIASRAKNAAERLERESNSESRLFVVDAGLDLAALRSRYPDRNRFMVVRGKLRLIQRSEKTKRYWTGRIDDVSVPSIHVPVSLSAGLRREGRAGRYGDKTPAFVAKVAIGQRLEPWLLGLDLQQTGVRDAEPKK